MKIQGENPMKRKDMEYASLKILFDGEKHSLSQIAKSVGVKPLQIEKALAEQMVKEVVLVEKADDPIYRINKEHPNYGDLKIAVTQGVEITREGDGTMTISAKATPAEKDLETSALKLLFDKKTIKLSALAKELGASGTAVKTALTEKFATGLIKKTDVADPVLNIDEKHPSFETLRIALTTGTKVKKEADGTFTISSKDWEEQ